jgi:uncharacterized protein (TIGR03083 family)
MTIDLSSWYRSARQRVGDLATADGLDPDLRVPATPAWSVSNVVAHLAGIASDATSGNMAGAPSDEWTAAHIARGAGKSVAELVAEWSETGPMFEGFLATPAGMNAAAAVMDVHCHEADLRHALGLALDVPGDFLEWAGASMRDRFHSQVDEAGLAAIDVQLSDVEWFRGRLGRRTEAEVRAYPWSSDPSAHIDTFFIFGPREQSLGEMT